MAQLEDSGRRLVADVKTVLADMDQFLEALRKDSSATSGDLRSRYDAAIRRARSQIADMRAVSTARARRVVVGADLFAHRHPWRTAGMAAASGVALGALVAALAARH